MSKLLRIAILGVTLGLLPALALAAQTRYQLRVDGLACPFCAYGIEKGLKRAQGVREVAIDIDAGTVTITMADDAEMTEQQAERIVEDAGFTLRAFRRVSNQD